VGRPGRERLSQACERPVHAEPRLPTPLLHQVRESAGFSAAFAGFLRFAYFCAELSQLPGQRLGRKPAFDVGPNPPAVLRVTCFRATLGTQLTLLLARADREGNPSDTDSALDGKRARGERGNAAVVGQQTESPTTRPAIPRSERALGDSGRVGWWTGSPANGRAPPASGEGPGAEARRDNDRSPATIRIIPNPDRATESGRDGSLGLRTEQGSPRSADT
jgi:hypothetical protein